MELLRIIVVHCYQQAWLIIVSWSMHASTEVRDHWMPICCMCIFTRISEYHSYLEELVPQGVMTAMLRLPSRPNSLASHDLFRCRATPDAQLGAGRAGSLICRQRHRQFARCSEVQHAHADALVQDILLDIENTGMAAKVHSEARAIAAHVDAGADQKILLQMADWT